MIEIKENQILEVHLSSDSSKWSDIDGAELESHSILYEKKLFKSFQGLKDWLSIFGLDIEEFKRFSEDEPDRLTFNRIEDENKQKYLIDYNLYLTLYNLDETTDFLKNFKYL